MSIDFTVVARERLSPTSATSFTAANIFPTQKRTIYVRIQALNGNIWYTTDGTVVTSLTGFLLPENSTVEIWEAKAISNFSCLDDGDGADLECKYMGRA